MEIEVIHGFCFFTARVWLNVKTMLYHAKVVDGTRVWWGSCEKDRPMLMSEGHGGSIESAVRELLRQLSSPMDGATSETTGDGTIGNHSQDQ